jgi:hypothetical protein
MSITFAEHTVIFTGEHDGGVRVCVRHSDSSENVERITDPERKHLLAAQLRAAAEVIDQA